MAVYGDYVRVHDFSFIEKITQEDYYKNRPGQRWGYHKSPWYGEHEELTFKVINTGNNYKPDNSYGTVLDIIFEDDKGCYYRTSSNFVNVIGKKVTASNSTLKTKEKDSSELDLSLLLLR